jgi:hypothetical protein
MMTKSITTAQRNARWRKSEDDKAKALLNVVNSKRAQLNLPMFSLDLPKNSKKGSTKQEYNPATKMSAEELSQWRYEQRLARKAENQRLYRKKKSALIKSLKEQITILDEAIEKKRKGEEINLEIMDAAAVIKECVDGDRKLNDVLMQCDSLKIMDASAVIKECVDGDRKLNHVHIQCDSPKIMDAAAVIKKCVDGDRKLNDIHIQCDSLTTTELEQIVLTEDVEEQVHAIDPLIELEKIHATNGLGATSWIHTNSDAFHDEIRDVPVPQDDILAVDVIDESHFDLLFVEEIMS